MGKNEIAVFGGGCFWCTEAVFSRLKGVLSVVSGYAGGTMENPTSSDVYSGTTGHAEVAQIEFDPTVVSYKTLLNVFWTVHDPTSVNRQGNDVGTEYRSVIFYTTEVQKKLIKESIENLKVEKVFDRPIITEVKPLTKFYKAENYNQDYYTKNYGNPYCEFVISPKISHMREKFSSLLK